jgi:hypothetical protein
MNKIRTFIALLSSALWLMTGCVSETMKTVSDRVFDRAVEQFALMDSQLDEGEFPRSLDTLGNLVTSDSKWWCCGFFPGSLWYTYEYSGNEQIKALAEKYTRSIKTKELLFDHDLGFEVWCSYGNAYRLTGDQTYIPEIEEAAALLATRYSPTVGAIRSWNNPHKGFRVIIDNMMNLELLEEASKMFVCDSLDRIARSHANTTMKNHFREDYTCWHLVNYVDEDGSVRRKHTVQGYSDDSAWARGQAWALYGYTMMYRETGLQEYLQQAVNVGNMILPYLPEDGVTYWDFNDPAIPDTYRDASAAAVMASAYLELSGYVGKKQKMKYKETAEKIIRTLASDDYLCAPGECHGFLLKHSVGSIPHGSEIDVPLTYADYYFLEALIRYKNL